MQNRYLSNAHAMVCMGNSPSANFRIRNGMCMVGQREVGMGSVWVIFLVAGLERGLGDGRDPLRMVVVLHLLPVPCVCAGWGGGRGGENLFLIGVCFTSFT